MALSPSCSGRQACKSTTSRRRDPLTNVRNAPAKSSSPPPSSPWQDLDSSEKAPSSKASGDDEVFIFPAIPAAWPMTRTSLSFEITSIPGVVAVGISSSSSLENHPHAEAIQSPPPTLSQQSTSRVYDDAMHETILTREATEEATEELHEPVLSPLQPTYSPPERTPTPSGLPSYEASQRAAETRIARRLIERHLGIISSGSVGGSRGGRRRGGGNTAGPRDAPVWRPPVSQHAFGSHPFMQDLDLQGGRGGGRGGFGAEIEMAARGGRSARPVRLEDYYFLRGLDGGREHLGARHSGNACQWTPCWMWSYGCLPRQRPSSTDTDLA